MAADFQELDMDFATFVAAIGDEAPLLPLYLCQERTFALSPRLGQRVTCYLPAGTTAARCSDIRDWAYLQWGNPPVTFVTVHDYPPEALRPTWARYMAPGCCAAPA